MAKILSKVSIRQGCQKGDDKFLACSHGSICVPQCIPCLPCPRHCYTTTLHPQSSDPPTCKPLTFSSASTLLSKLTYRNRQLQDPHAFHCCPVTLKLRSTCGLCKLGHSISKAHMQRVYSICLLIMKLECHVYSQRRECCLLPILCPHASRPESRVPTLFVNQGGWEMIIVALLVHFVCGDKASVETVPNPDYILQEAL